MIAFPYPVAWEELRLVVSQWRCSSMCALLSIDLTVSHSNLVKTHSIPSAKRHPSFVFIESGTLTYAFSLSIHGEKPAGLLVVLRRVLIVYQGIHLKQHAITRPHSEVRTNECWTSTVAFCAKANFERREEQAHSSTSDIGESLIRNLCQWAQRDLHFNENIQHQDRHVWRDKQSQPNSTTISESTRENFTRLQRFSIATCCEQFVDHCR